MCSNERLRSNASEIRRHFQVAPEFDYSGNFPARDKFPRQAAPVITRNEQGERQIEMMEWGHPHYKTIRTPDGRVERALKRNGEPYAPTPGFNIRHPHYPQWRDWIGPQYRGLAPSNLFAEPNPRADEDGEGKSVWFGMKEPEYALYAFAAIYRPWEGDWNKQKARATTNVYAILTTEPNELVEPIHKNAMPVILHPSDYETWLTAPWVEAKKLIQSFPADMMAIYSNPDDAVFASRR